MHTKNKLAAELRKAGLEDMAGKAAAGYYDDWQSPLAMPIHQLVIDLRKAGTPAAVELSLRAVRGEFDGTAEEGDAWADSAEGRETLGRLLKSARKFRP